MKDSSEEEAIAIYCEHPVVEEGPEIGHTS